METEVQTEFIYEAIRSLTVKIAGEIKRIADRIPPDIRKDIFNKGLYLTGGSSFIKNIDDINRIHWVKGDMMISPEEPVQGLKNNFFRQGVR